ncbi:deoxyribodipyrimidine photo-lyase [Massilia arenosa]|uniref:Deoxyribodipyrimidine photo-lyase n=1 Tax=Zemynaea arenosa TaxID=2561931 RepID=A0A4Y9SH93_9BURK|nr:deoxyribodipyrimidine photo-lyase [Massilia arenosa]TFW19699.1 deoxyribodipyrimidine photo-lyase [Massilia arenosa]
MPTQFGSALVWFRRDLRAFDHCALYQALTGANRVYCAFIFDDAILTSLPRQDRRVEFIHSSVVELDEDLRQLGGGLIVRQGIAAEAIPALAAELGVEAVFANEDYDPAAIERDAAVARSLQTDGRALLLFKDQVVFARDEVLTLAGKPFSVFTPYKNAWLRKLDADPSVLAAYDVDAHAGALVPPPSSVAGVPALEQIGFERTNLPEPPIPPGASGASRLFEDFVGRMRDYTTARDYPGVNGTSLLSVHLRFGTTSIRHLVRTALTLIANGAGGEGARTWLSELIWREFYQQILWHHPHVVTQSFKPAYDRIEFESGPEADELFAAWCAGRTGYPLVDAAMAQINATGFMHNRLRMVTASFLVKDLGIDWRWGERYFALHLNDYELASNNGGWQWAASSGCDAQPYFRIFNPVTQSERFDKDGDFIKSWLPALRKVEGKAIHAPWLAGGAKGYPPPIVDHDAARRKTLARYEVVKGR